MTGRKDMVRELQDLAFRLERSSLYTLLPHGAQDPDWFGALDFGEDHPIDVGVRQIIKASKKLSKQHRQASDLMREFTAALPADLRKPWLELERRLVGRNAIERIVAYNIGLNHGRDMAIVEDALRRSGVETKAIPSEALFIVAYVTTEIAKRLPLRRKG